jgi:hypothetical protein
MGHLLLMHYENFDCITNICLVCYDYREIVKLHIATVYATT